MPDNNAKLVYSTDETAPRKEKPVEHASPAGSTPAQTRVRVRLDRKARGGKSVTVVEGLALPQKEAEALLKQLKGRLGTGGALKDGSVEIQGDHCDTVLAVLTKMGYSPKRSGG